MTGLEEATCNLKRHLDATEGVFTVNIENEFGVVTGDYNAYRNSNVKITMDSGDLKLYLDDNRSYRIYSDKWDKDATTGSNITYSKYSDYSMSAATTTCISDYDWNLYNSDLSTTGATIYKCGSSDIYRGKWITLDGSGRHFVTQVPVTASERMREILRSRMAPAIIVRGSRRAMRPAADIREQRARGTFRRIVGEDAFRGFLRNGFVTVVPKSGLTYRIYPGSGMTEVYDRGIMVEKLCVVLDGNFPPTDSLIMRYLLILNDEGEFSQYAIKHNVDANISFSAKFTITPDVAQLGRGLSEIMAELKAA